MRNGTKTPTGDEFDLMAASGRGDREAYTKIVNRHHTTVFRFIYRMLDARDVDVAEDLAQDVFLQGWKAAAFFRPKAQVLTWLLTIATNHCHNHRRRMRFRRAFSLDARDTPEDADPTHAEESIRDFDADETIQQVRKALERLPEKPRAVIVLRHFHGLSYDALSDVLGVSNSAIESLLFRARTRLRAAIAEERKMESARKKPDR